MPTFTSLSSRWCPHQRACFSVILSAAKDLSSKIQDASPAAQPDNPFVIARHEAISLLTYLHTCSRWCPHQRACFSVILSAAKDLSSRIQDASPAAQHDNPFVIARHEAISLLTYLHIKKFVDRLVSPSPFHCSALHHIPTPLHRGYTY